MTNRSRIKHKQPSYRNPTRFFRERRKAHLAFHSFPYLITRIFPALYNINLYPKGVPESDLIQLARQQVRANKMKSCLALAVNRGLQFGETGQETWLSIIPKGGAVVNGRLKAPQDFSQSTEFPERSNILEYFSQQSLSAGGYLVGDPENCVREATPEDHVCLGELHGETIPAGLTVCTECGEWKGECFDPESGCYPDKVWKLTCRCENDNLCAACGETLFHHKLDACYFDKEASKILHVAGYLALSHECQK